MAGLGGANYGVYINFGVRNLMAGGMREVQAQLKAAQANADMVGKKTAAHLKNIQKQAAAFGGIYGNPKSYEEAKKNLDALAKRKGQLQNALAVEASRKQRQALNDQLTALNMTERDVRAKAKSYGYVVAEERTRLRMANAQQREQREQERARQRQIQQYHSVGNSAFKVSEYSGIGALGIGGLLFESGKAAAQQQQLASTTAMVMGLRGSALNAAMQTLMQSQLKTSMDVGMLSSADIAAVQTRIAQHVPGLGMKGLLDLTPFISKYADVMKMTLGESVEDSANTAVMAANIFGARSPKAMREFLNRLFVLEQSTGAPQQILTNALSQFGSEAKALGFTDQTILDLYGQIYRLGLGGGKVGARLGTLFASLGGRPTTVKAAYGLSQLGMVDSNGVPVMYRTGNQIQMDPILKHLHNKYEEMVRTQGTTGKANFITALDLAYGKTGSKVLMPLIQSGSLEAFEAQKKREAQFYNIEQAQAQFFHLPINQYQRFLTNLKTFVIEFGIHDLPIFSKFFDTSANKLQSWTTWMQDHSDTVNRVVSGLVNLAEVLAAISAASAFVGVVARMYEGFLTIKTGLAILNAAFASGASKVVASDTALATANMRAAGAAGSVAGKMGVLVGALGLVAVTYEFLKGLKINADMQKTHPAIKGSLIPGTVFGNNYAFAGPYGADGTAITAPGTTDSGPQSIILNLDGKKIGSLLLRQKNRTLKDALHSTTHGQGTTFMSPYQTLQTLNAPHTR